MPYYYFSCNIGCGIREAANIKQARSEMVKEIGSYQLESGTNVCRMAAKNDIEWVRGMGGWLPDKLQRR